jgi:hypothetical protein
MIRRRYEAPAVVPFEKAVQRQMDVVESRVRAAMGDKPYTAEQINLALRNLRIREAIERNLLR